MGCNALKIQKELIGEVLKEHFPGVSENSVLATKFVGPALFKLASHHLSAVAKVNKLDSKLKDRLLDFGINEKSNQAQANSGNKATNEKSTEIPSQISDSSDNQLNLNSTKEEVKVDKTIVEPNTNVTSTKVGILNGKVGMLSKTGKSLETKVEIKSMEQLIDLAADFNTAIEEYHGREIKDESVDHMASMFKELVSVKDFKPFTLKFDNSVEGLGLATGNSTITMTTNADAYKKVFGSPIRIVLHEYVHTITQMEMKNNPNNEVVKKIQALYDRVKNIEELKGEYGLTDVYEFVAEALSNPRFQAKLDKIGSKHTLVNKIKELFKSLLTWRKDKGGVTALDEILDLAVSLKNEKLNDTGKSKQAYQAETKQEDATILDKNADKTANNLYKWAKECAK